MNTCIAEKTKDDITIKIFTDSDPLNPRTDWDNLGTILYTSTRYILGDRRCLSKEIEDIISKDNLYIWLPVYTFMHGNCKMNTTGFSCPWDSGQSGIIFVEKSKVKEEYHWKTLTKTRIEQIKLYLKGEIETYSNYLEGNVYGFIKYDQNDQEIDSCWGFYDSPENIIKENL